MRILVAEDERFLADLVAEGLRNRAMALDVANDGDGAPERLLPAVGAAGPVR